MPARLFGKLAAAVLAGVACAALWLAGALMADLIRWAVHLF